MNRKTVTAIAGSIAVAGLTVAALVSITRADAGAGSQPASANQSAQPATQAVTVEVHPPEKRTMDRLLRMPATLRADEEVDLYAKTSGYVSAVKVDIGSRVHKGDVLLTIDVPEMQDELEQLEAALLARRARLESAKAKAAQAELMIEASQAEQNRFATERELRQITADRLRKLHKGQAITDQALDETQSALATAGALLKVADAKVASARGDKVTADAEVRVAEADIAVAEADVARLRTLMAYATIHAPFDGVITRRLVDHGSFVRSASGGSTTPLLAIAKDDRIRLTLQIPESDTPFIRVGTPVDIHVKTLDRHVQAKVARVAVALVPETRTMQTEVDLDNAQHGLSPGMYAHVAVQLESKANAMMVPSKAIHVRGQEMFVLVADNGMARSRPVQIGYDDGLWAEIVSGLTGSESIITQSRGVCVAGMAVQAVAGRSDVLANRG